MDASSLLQQLLTPAPSKITTTKQKLLNRITRIRYRRMNMNGTTRLNIHRKSLGVAATGDALPIGLLGTERREEIDACVATTSKGCHRVNMNGTTRLTLHRIATNSKSIQLAVTGKVDIISSDWTDHRAATTIIGRRSVSVDPSRRTIFKRGNDTTPEA